MSLGARIFGMLHDSYPSDVTRLAAAGCAAALWVALTALAPTRAEACTVPAPVTIELVSRTIPQDGLLAGIFKDCSSCNPDVIEVVDAAGQPVPGTLVALPKALTEQRWFAFRPARSWQVGATYHVQGPVNRLTPNSSISFMVVAGSSAEVKVSAKLSNAGRGVNEMRCAQYDALQLGSSCGTPVFHSDSVIEAQLQISVSELSATQLAYRVVWSADGVPALPETRLRPGQQFTRTFEGLPGEVCYELFALPLSEHGVERSLGKECKRPERELLGPRSGPFGEGALAYCTVPPAEYRAEWCQVLAASTSTWCTPDNWRAKEACTRAATECANTDAGVPKGPEAPSVDAGPDVDAGVPQDSASSVDAEPDADPGVAQGGLSSADASVTSEDGNARSDTGTTGAASPVADAEDDDSGCNVRQPQAQGGFTLLLSVLAFRCLRRRRSRAVRLRRSE